MNTRRTEWISYAEWEARKRGYLPPYTDEEKREMMHERQSSAKMLSIMIDVAIVVVVTLFILWKGCK